MRILVTNDDGILAPGLKVAQQIAAELAGPTGEVWTIAPSQEQSGVAHCVSYISPARIQQQDDRLYAVDGYPADCILAGVHDVLKETPPDLILSGVNKGNNSAENAMYSGTLGAAMEGALQGVLSIALSQFLGPKMRELDSLFEAASTHGAATIRAILAAHQDAENPSYPLFYNVNFPPCGASDVQGTRIAPQGRRLGAAFSMDPQTSPGGRRYLWISGGGQQTPSEAGTDAALNLEDYITVTPMRADLTAHDALDGFQTRWEGANG